jgi:hypothetical protein
MARLDITLFRNVQRLYDQHYTDEIIIFGISAPGTASWPAKIQNKQTGKPKSCKKFSADCFLNIFKNVNKVHNFLDYANQIWKSRKFKLFSHLSKSLGKGHRDQ